MNTWIWRSNQNIWKYVKSSIFWKFAGFGLQPYTKELLYMCFTKTKVICYTTFFKSSEKLLFRTASLLLYLSLTYLQKRKASAQQTTACSRSTIQKQYKLWKVYKGYNKDTGVSLLDIVLVSLFLTFNIGIVCRFVVRWHFCQFCSAGIYPYKFNSRNARTLDVESAQS